jgi:Uma2 family endonuclease
MERIRGIHPPATFIERQEFRSNMTTAHSPLPQEPEYAWEVATLFPVQGLWSEEAYLNLTDHTNRCIELTNGRLEFLTMPTEIHQALTEFFFDALRSFVQRHRCGQVRFTGLRLRIRPGELRQPDVLFLHKDRFHLRHNRVWDGADLVMEVVSDDAKDRARDYIEKLADYADAKIAEYWIVDPQRRTVVVHELHDGRYVVQGEFTVGTQAISPLLPGFTIDVTSLFAIIDDIPD